MCEIRLTERILSIALRGAFITERVVSLVNCTGGNKQKDTNHLLLQEHER